MTLASGDNASSFERLPLLRVAGLDVTVDVESPVAARAVRAAWDPALRLAAQPALGPAIGSLGFQIGVAELWRAGEVIPPPVPGYPPSSSFDRALLDAVVQRHAHQTILHAGGVMLAGRLFVILGQSGAGKSTFTRQLLMRGGSYLSDDLLVVEASGVRGVARTVQFDSVKLSNVPAFLSGFDVSSYLTQRGVAVVPLYRADYPVVDVQPLDGLELVVLRIQRGQTNGVRPLSAIERLGALHSAALLAAQDYQGQLDRSSGFWVDWENPDAAFELLLSRPELAGVRDAVRSASS